jgi:hypothetical protein
MLQYLCTDDVQYILFFGADIGEVHASARETDLAGSGAACIMERWQPDGVIDIPHTLVITV